MLHNIYRQIEGFCIYMRSRLSYDAAAKASRAGKKAFAQAYGAVLKNLKESHQFRLELSLLYGRDGLGTVSTNTSGALVITTPTWATGIWTGMKGAILEAFTSVAETSTQHNGDLTVSAVDVATKTITVTGTSAAVAPGDILYFKGAKSATVYKECPGLYRILTNTGSLFNIDAAANTMWLSQSYAVTGPLTLTAIFAAAALGMNYGMEKTILICNPKHFGTLAGDAAALRRYVTDTPNVKRGVKGLSFMLGSVDVEILPHPMVKEGHALMIAEDSIHRVGSCDIRFNLPGSEDDMEIHVQDSTAIELRSMSDQALFSDAPATNILLTGLT